MPCSITKSLSQPKRVKTDRRFRSWLQEVFVTREHRIKPKTARSTSGKHTDGLATETESNQNLDLFKVPSHGCVRIPPHREIKFLS